MQGLEHLKAPWLEKMMEEVFETKALTNCAGSFKDYWIPMLRNESQRTVSGSTLLFFVIAFWLVDQALQASLRSYQLQKLLVKGGKAVR